MSTEGQTNAEDEQEVMDFDDYKSDGVGRLHWAQMVEMDVADGRQFVSKGEMKRHPGQVAGCKESLKKRRNHCHPAVSGNK